MITVTISDTLREQGVQAAANAANAANPDQWVSAEQYLQQVVDSAAISYANQYRVGVISSGAFVLRFTPSEYAGIEAASITDPIIAGFLARVSESAEVVLYADEVVQGLGYLVSQELLTAERAAEILSYEVPISPPEPVEPEPEPEPEPTPEP